MITDIWTSFRAMPLWVQIWVAVILVPVNLAPVFWWTAPHGPVITVLAIGGMAPNLIVMIRERGFSNTMALPHLVLWIPLVFVVLNTLTDTTLQGDYRTFLYILLLVDLVSLGFDIPDAIKWHKGDRKVAGRESNAK